MQPPSADPPPDAVAAGRGSGAAAQPPGLPAVAAALLLVVALVAAAHWPVLRAQAVSLDDNDFIKNNPLVTHPGWASTSRFFSEVLHPSTVHGYYLPLAMTSLMVDYALGGRPNDLRVFHRTSLVLHLLATALLVILLYRLFGALVPAAIAGLLFGLHPLTVEPVAWVGERKTLLAACFALAALVAYIESLRRARVTWRTVALVCFALALLSKPTVAPLPLLLLVLDWWPLKRLSPRAVLEKWPFFALSIVSAAITVVSQERAAVIAPQTAHGILSWPVHAGYLLAFYMGKILAPVNLTCVYPPPQPFDLSNPVVAWSLGLVLAVAVVLALAARRARAPLAAAAFFVLAIAPTLGLVRYSWVIASDKYAYFPAVGLMVALTAGIAIWGAATKAPVWTVLAALLVTLILATEAYGVRVTLRHWKDTPTLFSYMDRLAPDAAAVKNGLAMVAMAESKPDLAIQYLRESIALEPDFSDTRYNLGILLASRGEFPEALLHLRRAAAVQPNDYEILGVLGETLRLSGNARAAADDLQWALRVRPDFHPGMVSLGEALLQAGEPAEGSAWLRRAVNDAPADAGLRYELAGALLQVPGGTLEAVLQLRRVVELRPDLAPPLNTLAWLLATSPEPSVRDAAAARRLAEHAAELTQRRRPEVLDTYAAALAATGDFAEAARVAESAVRLAREGHAEGLAMEIGTRLALYRAHKAYVSPAPR